MPLALIVSSFVAGSRVGGFPQALALARHGVDPVLAPTVLFGRRPGLGTPPGGAAVDEATLRGVLDGVRAHGLFGLADVVICGYFASAGQVEIAAETLDAVRAAPRDGPFSDRALVVVDPIMGDEPDGLFVAAEVAEAIGRLLLPRADVLTPNLWELRRLTGAAADGPDATVAAARTLGKPTLVTSVPGGPGEIGAIWVDRTQAARFTHRRLESPPAGTGDLVAATLAAWMIGGLPAVEAAERAIRAAAEAVEAAAAWSSPELPLVNLGDRLLKPAAEVRVDRLAGAR